MSETPAKKTAKKAAPKAAPVEATEAPVEAPQKAAPKAKVSEAPVLRRSMEFGDRNDTIKWVQEKLASLGYEVGRIDGSFDTLLAKSLRPIQAKHGLRVRAVLTPELYDILKKM